MDSSAHSPELRPETRLAAQLPVEASENGAHSLGPLSEPVQEAGKQHVTIVDDEPAAENILTVLPRAPLKGGELLAYALPAFSTTSLSLLISLYANDFYGVRSQSLNFSGACGVMCPHLHLQGFA